MYKQFIVANRQVLYLLALLLSGCASIEKHNLQITKLHTPEELRDDVDFAYCKLQKLQPDLYWYISKDSLDKKFSLLKNNLQQPLSTKEFYQQIAPVIASIRQGHNMTYPSF